MADVDVAVEGGAEGGGGGGAWGGGVGPSDDVIGRRRGQRPLVGRSQAPVISQWRGRVIAPDASFIFSFAATYLMINREKKTS